MADPATHLANLFNLTLGGNQEQITAATEELNALSLAPGFVSNLLSLIVAPDQKDNFRLAASIYFKNHVMRYWVPDEGEPDHITPDDRAQIKASIVALFMAAPARVEAQLEHALGIISHAEFPDQWPDLIQTIVSSLGEDPAANTRAFQVLNTITYHFRVRGETPELMRELLKVDKELVAPTKAILTATVPLLDQASTDPAALTAVLSCLHYVLEVFYSLMYQELYTDVEEAMEEWFGPIATVMAKASIAQAAAAGLPSGPVKSALVSELDKAQTAVCAIARLFAEKYEEAFAPFVESFVNQVWELLTTVSADEQYDALVSTAISFLSSMCRKEWYKGLFENNLQALCERIAVPQIQIRDSDEEQFEFSWSDYVDRDMNGADADTRRRTAADLITALCVHFEAPVSAIMKQYVAQLTAAAAAAPAAEWKQKDVAMFIILAVTIKSKTRTRGAVALNPHIDVSSFFLEQVLPELESAALDATPIVKADCLKFITQFRSQLPTESLPSLFKLCMRWLKAPSPVVHSYAAIAIEKLLSVKEADNVTQRLPVATIADALGEALDALFSVLSQPDSAVNEHVMLAILRVVSVGKELVFPFASAIIEAVAERLTIVAQNPYQPRFNHNLFEVLACLIHHLCKQSAATVDSFVARFLPIFETILGSDACNDLQPYTFQILAQLLEFSTSVSDAYASVFPSLLFPVMWETQANCPAIARLLSAYLDKGYAAQVSEENLRDLLRFFYKLNAHSKLDGSGFQLVSAIIAHLPVDRLGPYITEVLRLQFGRLRDKKTPEYQAGLAGFYAAFTLTHGAEALLGAINSVQANMDAMVLERVWVPALGVVVGVDKKAVAARGTAAMVTHLLQTKTHPAALPLLLAQTVLLAATAKSPASIDRLRSKFGASSGAAAAGENTDAAMVAADDDMLDLASSSFKSAYVRLVFATPMPSAFAAGYDGKALVGQIFAQFPAEAQQTAGMMPPEAQGALQQLMV